MLGAGRCPLNTAIFNLSAFLARFQSSECFQVTEINIALVSIVFTKAQPDFIVPNTKAQILGHIDLLCRII